MPSLFAALIAFLAPGGVMAATALMLGARIDLADLAPLILMGAWYAAPFLVMRLHRERARGRPVAIVVGLLAVLAAYGLLILDAALAEPGRGVNIGAALVMMVLPIPLYFAMLALSFVRWPIPRPERVF
jgi:hypothetical protein